MNFPGQDVAVHSTKYIHKRLNLILNVQGTKICDCLGTETLYNS